MSTPKFIKVNLNWKKLMVNNFLGGISWGLGATIGVSLILALLGFIFAQFSNVPVIGDVGKSLENISTPKK